MRYWPFFVLAFTILAGTAGQGIGLYIFGIFLPLWFYRSRVLSYTARLPLAPLAVALMGLYWAFPLFDLINQLLASDGSLPQLSAAVLVRGPLSSGFMSVGFCLMILALLNRGSTLTLSAAADGQETSGRVFAAFSYGLLCASLVLMAYVLVQAASGYDYRELVAARPDRLLPTGWYRPSGFYTHPLSLAGVGLALGSFYWSVFWQALERRGPELILPLGTSFSVGLLQFALVFLTASRTAALVAALMLIGVPLCSSATKQFRQWKLVAMGVLLIPFLYVSRFTGLWSRLKEALTAFSSNSGDHRLEFWRVHWQLFQDRPWTGHGFQRLAHFQREAYYDALGLGALPQKYNAHNIYLELLAELGVLGTGLVLALLAVFLLTLRRASEREAIGDLLMRAFLVAIFANGLHGLTQNTFFDSNIAFSYLCLFLLIFWSLVDHAPYQAPPAQIKEGLWSQDA